MSLWRTIRWSGGAVPNWNARRFWQAPKTLDAADPQIPNLPLLTAPPPPSGEGQSAFSRFAGVPFVPSYHRSVN